jgi:hypothetical protein
VPAKTFFPLFAFNARGNLYGGAGPWSLPLG